MMGIYYYISLRYLVKNCYRSLLTIIGISVGISLFTAIRIINRSTLESFQNNIETIAGKASLVVTAGDLGFPEDRLEILEQIPGIRSAVPLIIQQVYYSQTTGSKGKEPFFVFGMDLLRETSIRQHQSLDSSVIEDPLEFLNQADSLILADSFAKQNHVTLGSPFQLTSVHGVKQFTVRGLLANTGLGNAYQGRVAIMDIDAAQVVFGKVGKLDRIDLLVEENITKKTVAFAELIKTIETHLGEGYQVQKPEMQGQELNRMIHSFQIVLSLFSTLALLVGMVLIFNTVSISINERKQEIGTLRAVGAQQKTIVTLFLYESLLMGFLGSLVGIFSAVFLARYLSHWVALSISTQYLVPIEMHTIHLKPGDWVLALFVGMFSSLLAAMIPSLKTTRIYPLEAIQTTDLLQTPQSRLLSVKTFLLAGIFSFTYFVISSLYAFGNYHLIFRFVETLAAMATAAFFGPVIVYISTQALAQIKSDGFPFILKLAIQNLNRNFTRTSTNVISLMVGLILLVLISSMNHSFKSTFKVWIQESFPWDFFVSTQGNFFQFQTQPMDENFSEDLCKIPGLIKNKFGRISGFRYMKTYFEGKPIAIKGFDFPYDEIKYAQFFTFDRNKNEVGPILFDFSEPHVMVSDNFVQHFHKKTGDLIEINTPNGKMRARIIAIIRDYTSNEGVIYVARHWITQYWKDHLVNSFSILVDKKYSIDQLQQEVLNRYGEKYPLAITPTQSIRATIEKTLDQSLAYTQVIELASLIIASLSIFNTLLVSVLERKKEFSGIKAVGMSPQQTFLLVLYESMIQGLLGSVASILLGVILSYFWVTYTLADLLGWIVSYSISKKLIFLCTAIGLWVTFVAGIFPAWRASQIKPGRP